MKLLKPANSLANTQWEPVISHSLSILSSKKSMRKDRKEIRRHSTV